MQAIEGAILGDIAGSQYEFPRMRPENLDWKNCELFTDKCRFTDDTVCTLAIKKAIMENPDKPEYEKWMREICNKYQTVGYGGMFKRWLSGEIDKPYESFGNGSAMRVSYVGQYYNTNDLKLSEEAIDSAKITHNSKQGILGAMVTASLINLAKKGYDKTNLLLYVDNMYSVVEQPYPKVYDLTMEWLRENYKWDVTCQGSVPIAFRCFYEAENWEEFMRNVMSLHCDMDTLGAIGGGFAAQYFATKGIKTSFNVREVIERYLDDYLLDILYADEEK